MERETDGEKETDGERERNGWMEVDECRERERERRWREMENT